MAMTMIGSGGLVGRLVRQFGGHFPRWLLLAIAAWTATAMLVAPSLAQSPPPACGPHIGPCRRIGGPHH